MFDKIRNALANRRSIESRLADAEIITARYKNDCDQLTNQALKLTTRNAELTQELKTATNIAEARMNIIRDREARNDDLESGLNNYKSENKRLRNSVAHMIHFMYHCKQVVDGFTEAANKLPDHAGLDSVMAQSILKEFHTSNETKLHMMEKLSARSVTIEAPADDEGTITNGFVITVKMLRDAIIAASDFKSWDEYDPDNWIEFNETQLYAIKELGLFTIDVNIDSAAIGNIKLWVVPKA